MINLYPGGVFNPSLSWFVTIIVWIITIIIAIPVAIFALTIACAIIYWIVIIPIATLIMWSADGIESIINTIKLYQNRKKKKVNDDL